MKILGATLKDWGAYFRSIGRMVAKRAHPSVPDNATIGLLAGGTEAASGVSVTEDTALNFTAVYTCVRILAETVASLPLPVYRRLSGGGKERAIDHPLYVLLHDQPNPEQTSFELREMLMSHLALRGNAYAEIERDGAGRVSALWPLLAWKMKIRRLPGTHQLQYEYQLENGDQALLRPDQVLHLRGLSPDGIIGYSPIRIAREAVGLGLAAEEYGARFFSNQATPSGVLEHPGELSEEAKENLQKSWEKLHQGLSKSHRIAILEEGMKLHTIGIAPEDAQFLETRRFQLEEIARIYRIPPHMVGDLEKASYSNIEHQAIEFVVHCIRPWLVRWEQAMKRSLFLPQERGIYFAEFLVDGLLRGDIKSRYEAYSIGRQWGWLSADDVRELENQNPLSGGAGKIYLVPLNMVPADRISPTSVEDGQPQDESRSELASERRSAERRRRLAAAFLPLFRETEARILRRETHDVLQAARRLLARRDLPAFLDWLAQFYQNHKAYMTRAWSPAFGSLAAETVNAVREELGQANAQLPEAFLPRYTESHVELHAEAACGQLQHVAESSEDQIAAIEERLLEWSERRPDKIARWETVQITNAVAVETYKASGIQRIRWVIFDEHCPYCRYLNGKVIGIDSAFLESGVPFQPEGAEKPLRPSVKVRHAPAHDGCDCQVVASS